MAKIKETPEDMKQKALVLGMFELFRRHINSCDWEIVLTADGPMLSLAMINQKIDEFEETFRK